jgi:KDO2-lipid IV(A) lauroyltransferase
VSAARRSAFRDRLEYAAFRAALWSLEFGSRDQAFRTARFYVGLLDRAVPKLRRTAIDNLRFALPDKNARALIDGVFDSVARVLVAFARFPNIDRTNVGDWLRMEGLEHVETALARGHGVLFATAHLGNWELSAFAFALLNRPLSIVVRPLDNPLIDAFVERTRRLSGNKCIGKRDYVRGILQALSRNEMVGALVDQHDQDGVLIDFFARPARTSTGIARFAAKTGAAVIPGFALWSAEEQKYILRFLPEVVISGVVEHDTQNIHRQIEAMIREYPDQWMWIHRRWKG